MASPQASSDAAIVFEGVSKQYGNANALQPIDLSVRRGEFLSLLGPSGSGKSTILNLIAGAVAPSSGRLLIDGEDVSRKPARERGLGMVFQNYALLPHLNVFDNVAFPLRIRGASKDEVKKKVAEALDRVGLNGYEHRKPREMSGGQQQRVGIARCIVYAPKIILMDEPLGALDKKLRGQLQDEIKRLHRELGTTLVYVTHDQEEALNLSDRVCLMSGGKIAQHGTPDELYFEPASEFVADFVGESNLFKGALGADLSVSTDTGLVVRVEDGRGHAVGSAVKVLVRPEKVVVGEGGPADNRASGIVQLVSFVGGTTRFEIKTERGATVLVTGISERSVRRIAVGDQVSVHWAAHDSIVLAQE